jgi:hypothetical protein
VAKVQASGTVGAKKKVKGAKSKETKELEKVKAQLAAANKQCSSRFRGSIVV